MTTSGSLERDLKAIFNPENPAKFDTLVRVANLDPTTDFIEANLRGLNLAKARLHNFNFTRADLRDTFIRHATVHQSTILHDAVLDIEDSLFLRKRGFLVNQRVPTIEHHEKSLQDTIDELTTKYMKLVDKSKSAPEDAGIRYELGIVIATIGGYEARLGRFEEAIRRLAESRNIFAEIANTIPLQRPFTGLIQRLDNEISRYSTLRSKHKPRWR